MSEASEERVVLITGGTAGIGLACAEIFYEQGARVVLAARDAARGRAACEALGPRASFVQADLSQRRSVRALFDAIGERLGHLDVAVNNAGTDGASFTRLMDYPEEVWEEVLRLNVTSVFWCLRHEIPLMAGRSGASIVNVASLAGLRASYSGGCAYTASKHALIGLTRSAALDQAGALRINAVCPGVIGTEATLEALGDRLPEAAALHPMGRIGEPAEVARVVAWLASDAASFVTGAAIPVGGGIMAR